MRRSLVPGHAFTLACPYSLCPTGYSLYISVLIRVIIVSKHKVTTARIESGTTLVSERLFNGTLIEQVTPPTSTLFTSTVDYGDNYRNWKDLLRSHQQATTTLLVSQVSGVNPVFRIQIGWRSNFNSGITQTLDATYTRRGRGSLYSPAFFGSADFTIADSLAKQHFLQRVRATRNQFQGGVFLGELREAIHMIRHPAQSLLRGIDSYLHAASRRVRKSIAKVPVRNRLRMATGILGDTWLEYSFGWSPFIKDIADAQKALARRAENFVGRPVHGIGKASSRSSTKGNFTGGFTYYDTLEDNLEETIVIYRGYVAATLDKAQKTASLLGFTPEQFLPTVWELVPWSFLSDYFINIDDIIESASTSLIGLNWVAKTTVRKLDAKKHFSWNAKQWAFLFSSLDFYATVQSMHTPPFTQSFQRKEVSRAPYTGSLVPSLRFTTRLGDKQFGNIAALLASKTFGLQKELGSLLRL